MSTVLWRDLTRGTFPTAVCRQSATTLTMRADSAPTPDLAPTRAPRRLTNLLLPRPTNPARQTTMTWMNQEDEKPSQTIDSAPLQPILARCVVNKKEIIQPE